MGSRHIYRSWRVSSHLCSQNHNMANKRFRKSLTFTLTRLVNLLNLVCMPQIVSRHVKFDDEGAIHRHGATQRTSLAEVFPCRAFQHSKSCQEVFHTTSTMGAGLAMIRDVIVKKNNIFDFPLHLHKVWNRRIVSQIGANVETNELDQFAGRDTKTCKNA